VKANTVASAIFVTFMVFSFFLRSAFSLDKETMRHVPDLSVQFFFSAMNTPSCSHLAEPRCSSNRLPSRDVRVSDFPVFAERLENGRQDMLTPEQMAGRLRACSSPYQLP
jgi:hypothetical protein